MATFSALWLVALLFASSSPGFTGSPFLVVARTLHQTEPNSPCGCDSSYNQVCCSGATFVNYCHAQCAGYKNCGPCPIANFGYCEEIARPVICAGKIFTNQCFAELAGYSAAHCVSA